FFGRLQDIFEDLGTVILLADLAQIGSDFAPFPADAMTSAACDTGGFEKDLSASRRVAGQSQNLFGLDDGSQSFRALRFRQIAFEQVADMRFRVLCRSRNSFLLYRLR